MNLFILSINFIYAINLPQLLFDLIKHLIWQESNVTNLKLYYKNHKQIDYSNFCFDVFVKITFSQMNQVSQFCLEEKTPLWQKNNLTPLTNNTKYGQNKQIYATTTIESRESNHKCVKCPEYLSSITQGKKVQILLEYQLEKLKQQIQRLKRQNQHLVHLQYSHHKINLEKYNPLMYFKEDLQSELAETKYLLQLHLLSKSLTPDTHSINPSIIKQSKRQKQSLQKLSKPYHLKKKCEELLLQNIRLQQKVMIKDKIIEKRGLFPLYHYDQRILTLRKNVQYWYSRAQQESSRLKQMINDAKNSQTRIRKQAKLMVEQEKVFWQGQLKKIVSKLKTSSSFNQNQVTQKQNYQILQNQNILIENDHTILSLCEGERDKKGKSSLKIDQRRMGSGISKSIHHKSSNRPSENICSKCVCTTMQKNVNKITTREAQKSSNTCKPSSRNESKNNSGKTEGKYQAVKGQERYQSGKNPQKYLTMNAIIKSEVKEGQLKKRNKKQSSVQANTSLIGGRFSKIEIKTSPQQERQKGKDAKKSEVLINCQRCAKKII